MKRLVALSLLFVATSAVAKSHDAYILSVGPGPGVMLLTTGIDIEDAVSRRQHYGHDFLWVRRNGHDYWARNRKCWTGDSRLQKVRAGNLSLTPDFSPVLIDCN